MDIRHVLNLINDSYRYHIMKNHSRRGSLDYIFEYERFNGQLNKFNGLIFIS